MHQSCDSTSSAWTPESCPGKRVNEESFVGVNGPYYALTFVASFVKGARDFRVIPIRESDDFVVYAGYEGGKLSRIAIVNLSTQDDQGAVTFDVRVPSHVMYFKQTAGISQSSLRPKGASVPGTSFIAENAGEMPLGALGGTSSPRFVVQDGSLTVKIGKAQAVLLVPQY